MNKIWILVERPTPPEEPVVLGSSNDEEYIDIVMKALRSLETEATYWKEAIPFLKV